MDLGIELALADGAIMNIFTHARRLWQKLPWRWPAAAALAAALGAVIGRNFLASVCVVNGPSMSPSFPPGSFLFTMPISSPLERGDVVLINDGHEDLALKRIVGLPGETVMLWRGMVFVNRQAIREPYVPRNVYTFPRGLLGACVLGDQQYFVLGDNRLNSVDSRIYGPVEIAQIKRRISQPKNALHPGFEPYLLPDYGEMLPRRIVPKPDTASAF
jgi:signal peptidase I